jgi:hypothetical protein
VIGHVDPASILPAAHRTLLARRNGFTLYHGAYRLFGIGRDDPLDLAAHNDHETWRFAWDDRVEPFVFIGASAWGDQYAYRRSPDGGVEESVYFLEGTLLTPEVIAPSFDQFLRDELMPIRATSGCTCRRSRWVAARTSRTSRSCR